MKLPFKLCYTSLLVISISSFTTHAATAPVVADTYVDGSNTTQNIKNFGGTALLNISKKEKTFLGFSFSTLPADITENDISKATLFLYVKSASTAGKLLVKQVSNGWSENVVTYNTLPLSLDLPTITSTNITQKEIYLPIDITSIVKNWVSNPTANYGLSIEPSALNLKASFDSKESTTTSHHPYIDIVFNRANTSQGTKGDKGDQGIQCIQGLKGDQGIQGIQGLKGDQGIQGIQGLKGDQGIQGASGSNDIKSGDALLYSSNGFYQEIYTQLPRKPKVVEIAIGTGYGGSIVKWVDTDGDGYGTVMFHTMYNLTSNIYMPGQTNKIGRVQTCGSDAQDFKIQTFDDGRIVISKSDTYGNPNLGVLSFSWIAQ